MFQAWRISLDVLQLTDHPKAPGTAGGCPGECFHEAVRGPRSSHNFTDWVLEHCPTPCSTFCPTHRPILLHPSGTFHHLALSKAHFLKWAPLNFSIYWSQPPQPLPGMGSWWRGMMLPHFHPLQNATMLKKQSFSRMAPSGIHTDLCRTNGGNMPWATVEGHAASFLTGTAVTGWFSPMCSSMHTSEDQVC